MRAGRSAPRGIRRLMGGLPIGAALGLQSLVTPGRGRRLPFPLAYRLHGRRVMILGLPWRGRGGAEPPSG